MSSYTIFIAIIDPLKYFIISSFNYRGLMMWTSLQCFNKYMTLLTTAMVNRFAFHQIYVSYTDGNFSFTLNYYSHSCSESMDWCTECFIYSLMVSLMLRESFFNYCSATTNKSRSEQFGTMFMNIKRKYFIFKLIYLTVTGSMVHRVKNLPAFKVCTGQTFLSWTYLVFAQCVIPITQSWGVSFRISLLNVLWTDIKFLLQMQICVIFLRTI